MVLGPIDGSGLPSTTLFSAVRQFFVMSAHIIGRAKNEVATRDGGAEVTICKDVAFVAGVKGLAAYRWGGPPLLLGTASWPLESYRHPVS